MVDIKPDMKKEMPLQPKERPTAAAENLNRRPEGKIEAERHETLEKAQKQVIEEILRSEPLPPPTVTAVGGVSLASAQRQKQIEKALSSGLSEIYAKLAPEKQREFKKVGEETAKKINLLLNKAKVNIGEIIKLIKKWLAIIPGVNKYFLEKEAKIKADEIMKMRK